jgi:spermidine/putrescine ABC transporter ATP-binding subunit
LSLTAERPDQLRSPPAADVVALPAGHEIAVSLDGVSKRFGAVTALHENSLAIRRGELMTLLGPSGCGKTTLLNLVAGFVLPDSGEIAIDGQRITTLPTHRRKIGMMFQSYALFPHMTVAANVGYGLRMRRLAKREIAAQVADALTLVRLTGLEDRKPRQLSGGQQQRVALARALVIKPKVLLLDEPFSALDKGLRTSMQAELRDIQRKLGVTTIFVTHDQSEALSLSDRIAVMSAGRIRQCGTPDEIYRRPSDRFVASFVGDVNVLHARLDRVLSGSASVALGAASIAVPAEPLAGLRPGAPVDLFVRAEQLRIAGPADPTATEGIVAGHVYQGAHIDLHVDVPEAASGRLTVRLPGYDGIARWPAGTRIAVAVDGADAVAFPRGSD